MWWILMQIIMSLIIISIMHYLYFFLRDKLSTPKIKDLVHHPKEKYKDMYKIINEKPKISIQSMKDELGDYLTSLAKGN